MSERLKSTSVSNEDVVSDLTKDLHSSLKIDDMPVKLEREVNASNSAQTVREHIENPACADPTKENHSLDPEEQDANDKSDEESDKEGDDDDDDDDDEVALKDAELELTDDQKAERLSQAEALKQAGNDAFKDQEYTASAASYSTALQVCPLSASRLRAVLYCNRSAARMKMELYKKAIKDCDKAIELDDTYVKAYLRRAHSNESTDKLDESLADFEKVLELDPSSPDAQAAVHRLPGLIEQRNEKLKTEMMGKLKELGNMVLRPFGLSTNNFNLEQDPATKEYKINFKQ